MIFMKKIIIVAIFMVGIVWFVSGCEAKGGLFGESITEIVTTRIGDILASADKFDGKTVKLEGKIIEECPAGGWFMLKDETGVIYVNLHSSYFAIPQAIGHKVVTQGIVKREHANVSVIGKGVQVK